MQVYPEKYDQLELTVEEKSFLRTIQRAFSDEEMAYYVLHINPRKRSSNGNPELFNLMIVSKGIFLFRFLNAPTAEIAALFVQSLSAPAVYGSLVNDIQNRLEESRYLTNAEGDLNHALNVCFVLPNFSFDELEDFLSDDEQAFCRQHVISKETVVQIRKTGAESLLNKLSYATEITENLVNNIFQRLCPELTIPRKFILDENASIHAHDGLIRNNDRAVQSYRLDDRQINIINKIAKGNQLILACAGSGKSVLLISKCFKLASLNPDQNFLITCYNRNLHNYYQWAIAQAGFTDKNVRCSTFFGLCRQLLESNHLPLPAHYSAKHNAPDDYYDRLFEAANNALASKKIKERFYGIFIDEVQIFKPEWYRFCFNLLCSKNADDHFFVIAGDKSQDIKNNIKNSRAPWQGGGSEYPEYRGKTLPIETNYRNSKQINDAIDRFVASAKICGESLGADLTSDPELFLRGTAYREGNEPHIIELKDLSNEGEATAICDEIKRLIEAEGLSEVDIAVILYNRHAKYTTPGWATHYYNLLAPIKQRFYQEGWENPAILMSGESEGATYGSRRGVTIATIEGSLGLDFRAVILAGLRPLGTHEKARTIDEIRNSSGEVHAQKLEAFKKNVNFIYTGCTRAKDELTIILSAPEGQSVYMDLIRESMGGTDEYDN